MLGSGVKKSERRKKKMIKKKKDIDESWLFISLFFIFSYENEKNDKDLSKLIEKKKTKRKNNENRKTKEMFASFFLIFSFHFIFS